MADETISVHDSWDGLRNEGPGTVIGAFTLVRRIGEGGFGDVYEADQQQPVRRRVALKIIKLGMDTREVIRRFGLERQSLALMDHPHIARVIDAGATDAGRPYFVMELVDGVPITEYCAAKAMSVDGVLQLFEQVCAAVQHAHTKGIIHRDLKPGNVLVGTHDGRPFAKVIDFGIAKATGGEHGEGTVATKLNQVMGTPLYMSPEQAIGSPDIDTRTDIYSLGVILYELLTGTTPVEREKLLSVSIADTQRLIRESDPPRPSLRLMQSSTTLTGTATFRPVDPRKLARTLRGELDWIVMKALEKEPGRRYQSALELADDLRRYLGGEAVHAAPPAVGYRLRKFIRRNRTAVAAGSLVALSLVVGVVAFAWQAHIASQRATDLEQVTAFESAIFKQVDPARAGELLTADMRGKFDASLRRAGVPESERGARSQRFAADLQQVNATDAARAVIDQSVLKPAAAIIDKQFAQQPLIAARLRQALANRYVDLGLYDQAMPLQVQALDARRRLLGDDNAATAFSEFYMAALLQRQGRFADAGAHYQRSLAMVRKLFGDDDPRTFEVLGNLGLLYGDAGRFAEAEKYYRAVLDGRTRLLGKDNPETLLATMNMGALLRTEHKFDQAEPYLRDAAADLTRVAGPNDDVTLYAQGNLALLAEARGQLGLAETKIQDALQRARRTFGDSHPTTLLASIILGGIEEKRGRHAEAERLLASVQADARAELKDDFASWFGLLEMHLGQARAGLGRYPQAETDLLAGEAILAQPHAAQEPDDLRDCRQALADLYAAWDRAEPGKGLAAKSAAWKLRQGRDGPAPPGVRAQ